MKRVIIVATIALFAFTSCKKDKTKTDPIPQETVLDYFPLTAGNYWIYERYRCDSTWTNCESIGIDTSFVTMDTTINNHVYHKVVGIDVIGESRSTFYRDSLNYIVDNKGHIYFSNTDFSSKLTEEYVKGITGDTLFYWYYQMQEVPYGIDVPAGSFSCLDNKMFFYKKTGNLKTEFNTHHLFAKNVGSVYRQAIFAHDGSGFKQELVDYNIIQVIE